MKAIHTTHPAATHDPTTTTAAKVQLGNEVRDNEVRDNEARLRGTHKVVNRLLTLPLFPILPTAAAAMKSV